jgi:hypothetical protein
MLHYSCMEFSHEDIRVVKNAFKDPKNCQNREQELSYQMVGI